MRIKRVKIKQYKNLKDFDCVFSDSNISAFIGNNGSGKSNLLEAITTIFSYAKSISEKNNPKLIVTPDIEDYIIEYENNGVEYTLKGSYSDVSLFSREATLSKISMEAALPETIMLYYAGETTRQYDTAKRTFDERYDNKLKKTTNAGFTGFKYLDYYSSSDLNLLLLTAAVFQGDYYDKLLRLINCSGISFETSFILKNPAGKRTSKSADTYWGARGFVKSFLDETRRFVSKTIDLSEIYFMNFKDISPIKGLSADEAEMFAKLKALKNAGYLDSMPIKLQRADGEEFSYDELSEGEKQLALLMLLTSFTAQKHCLYLFDEFDAYLHLNWQKAFTKMLNSINVDGHLLFTTHSPATVSGMKRKNVYIMDGGKARTAPSETYQRSFDEIMEEHMLVSMRPQEYTDLVQKFRNAVIHGRKDLAEEALMKLREIVSENDPFFITARIALNRME